MNNMKNLLLAFFFGFSFLPASYAAFENCEAVDTLPSIIPSDEDWKEFYHEDWNEAYLLRASDGSMWQRAVLSNPGGSLNISGNTSRVVGVGTENSPLQVFIFSANPDEKGRIARPGQGVCFTPGKTSATGQFSFHIPSSMLWGSLGSNIAFDVYTRLSGNWDSYVRSDTNQNFFFGTHRSLQYLRVSLSPIQSTNPIIECPSLCTGTDDILYEALSLDPARLDARFLPDFFIAPIKIARNPDTLYFAQWNEEAITTEEDFSVAQKITSMVLVSEWLKRLLLPTDNTGTGYGGIGLGEAVSAQKIRGIYLQQKIITPLFREMLDSIKALLTNTAPNREAVANNLAQILTVQESSQLKSAEITPLLLELFPGQSTEETWAIDFESIIRFWTGSQQQNSCVLSLDGRIFRKGIQPTAWSESQAALCKMNRVITIF